MNNIRKNLGYFPFPDNLLPHPDSEEAILLSRATVLHAQNISKANYELESLNIGPEWHSHVLDTLPLVLMMREMGVSFNGFQKGFRISERRNEFECEDTAEQDIMFAVKTCEKFHETRIPVMWKTWGKYAKYVKVYSDKQDDNAQTIKLPNWVEPPGNVFFGCNKTLSVLKHFLDDSHHHAWLVLVDDDTVLSVARVRQMISCYRDQEDLVMIGKFRNGKILEHNLMLSR